MRGIVGILLQNKKEVILWNLKKKILEKETANEEENVIT